MYTAVKMVHTVKDFFSKELWLVFGALASIIPPVVMSIEPRYCISLQSVIFGTAILGWFLPNSFANMKRTVKCLDKDHLAAIGTRSFPWAGLLWVIFIVLCLAHMGDLYAQSGLGTEILFQW